MSIEQPTPEEDAAWAVITASEKSIRTEMHTIMNAARNIDTAFNDDHYFTGTAVIDAVSEFCRDEATASGKPVEDIRVAMQHALDTFKFGHR